MKESSKAQLKIQSFAGVALGGGKSEKTSLAIVDYYPDQKRLFLREAVLKFSNAELNENSQPISQDLILFEKLKSEKFEYIAFDSPLQLPKCMRCHLKCPGYEKCKEPEIKWMWQFFKKRDSVKRPNKIFTPYTERAVEMYISSELEEVFHPSHALGSNAAPLTSRMHFLSRRLGSKKLIEVYPKLSLWRMGVHLDVPKSYLRFHKHSVDGDEARYFFLNTLIENQIAFIYQQDLKLMIEHSSVFDAFICALTAYLKFRGQSEKRPKNFPKDELWIDYPSLDFSWF